MIFEFLSALFAILFTVYAVKWHTRKPIRPKIVSDWRERFPLQEVESSIPNARAYTVIGMFKVGDRVILVHPDKIIADDIDFQRELYSLADTRKRGYDINYIGRVHPPTRNGLIRVEIGFSGEPSKFVQCPPDSIKPI